MDQVAARDEDPDIRRLAGERLRDVAGDDTAPRSLVDMTRRLEHMRARAMGMGIPMDMDDEAPVFGATFEALPQPLPATGAT